MASVLSVKAGANPAKQRVRPILVSQGRHEQVKLECDLPVQNLGLARGIDSNRGNLIQYKPLY